MPWTRRASIINGSPTRCIWNPVFLPIPSRCSNRVAMTSITRPGWFWLASKPSSTAAAGFRAAPTDVLQGRPSVTRPHTSYDAARPLHTSVCESPADHRLAGPDLERGNPPGGDFLCPPAPGLSRQGPDFRAGPLVPRLQIEDALAALAHVYRPSVGAFRAEFDYQHHRGGQIQAARYGGRNQARDRSRR